MKVIRNSVVALKYEVLDGRGEVVERGHEPIVYLHGGPDAARAAVCFSEVNRGDEPPAGGRVK